jgi:hypothetical protein
VRVPLPLAAAVLLMLRASAVLALRRPAPGGTAAQPASGAAVQSARGAEPALVTRTSLAGFRPVEEIEVSVVKEGRR